MDLSLKRRGYFLEIPANLRQMLPLQDFSLRATGTAKSPHQEGCIHALARTFTLRSLASFRPCGAKP